MDHNDTPNRSGSILGKRSRDNGDASRDSDDGSPSSGEPRHNEIYSSGPTPPISTSLELQNTSPFACTYEGCAKTFATAAHRKRHERSRRYTHNAYKPRDLIIFDNRYWRSPLWLPIVWKALCKKRCSRSSYHRYS